MSGVDVITFGCRLNTYESEVIKAEADKAGLSNALVFNTCAVTSEAVRQARQAIRRARRENPESRIIVTGCAAQTQGADFAEMPEVDLVLGNEEKLKSSSYRALPDFGIALPGGPHIFSTAAWSAAFLIWLYGYWPMLSDPRTIGSRAC